MKTLNVKEPLVLATEPFLVVKIDVNMGLTIFMEFLGHNDLIEAISLLLESFQDLLLSQGTLWVSKEPALGSYRKLLRFYHSPSNIRLGRRMVPI
jgi:hypothetical protein